VTWPHCKQTITKKKKKKKRKKKRKGWYVSEMTQAVAAGAVGGYHY
jgi:hypothetical protein